MPCYCYYNHYLYYYLGTRIIFNVLQKYSIFLILPRFLDAYNAEGVPIWGMTPQNEPLTGFEEVSIYGT